MFRDASGEVEVEVDQDVWRGTEVGPDDLIRIRGGGPQLEQDRSGSGEPGRWAPLRRARAVSSPSKGLYPYARRNKGASMGALCWSWSAQPVRASVRLNPFSA